MSAGIYCPLPKYLAVPLRIKRSVSYQIINLFSPNPTILSIPQTSTIDPQVSQCVGGFEHHQAYIANNNKKSVDNCWKRSLSGTNSSVISALLLLQFTQHIPLVLVITVNTYINPLQIKSLARACNLPDQIVFTYSIMSELPDRPGSTSVGGLLFVTLVIFTSLLYFLNNIIYHSVFHHN